jgi:hypothetical protein
MRTRCPFCHTEMEISEKIGAKGYCRCGAYGQIHLLGNAHLFREEARKALGVETVPTVPAVEVVDGGVVFEMEGEPAIIQWAKKPWTPHGPI